MLLVVVAMATIYGDGFDGGGLVFREMMESNLV